MRAGQQPAETPRQPAGQRREKPQKGSDILLISLTEYAKKNGKCESAARRMVYRGRFKSALKIGRNWVIDENEPWPDYRRKEYRGEGK